MTGAKLALPAACCLGLAALGCSSKPLADGLPDEVRCSDCHGSAESAAPPAGLYGIEATSQLGVGAHQIHLRDGIVRRAIGCSECHQVPSSIEQSGHADGLPAELTWGPLATAEGARPRWDRASGTCSSTYCHGETLSGGTRTAPVWTFEQPPEYLETLQPATCNGCHGAPPPAPHPAISRCSTCHPGTVEADGSIDVAGGRHLDGEVEDD